MSYREEQQGTNKVAVEEDKAEKGRQTVEELLPLEAGGPFHLVPSRRHFGILLVEKITDDGIDSLRINVLPTVD